MGGVPESREPPRQAIAEGGVAKLFDRATKVANPKKLHLTLAGIYERSQAGRHGCPDAQDSHEEAFGRPPRCGSHTFALRSSTSAIRMQIRRASARRSAAPPNHCRSASTSASWCRLRCWRFGRNSVERGPDMFESIRGTIPSAPIFGAPTSTRRSSRAIPTAPGLCWSERRPGPQPQEHEVFVQAVPQL